MKNTNLFIVLLLGILLTSCGEKNQNPRTLFSIAIDGNKKAISASEPLSFSVKSTKGNPIDGVTYTINGEEISGNDTQKVRVDLSDKTLGRKEITATIKSEGSEFKISETITILSATQPKIYDYKILEVYPHDITAYTQGLEFVGEDLYESTGQYGTSTLRKTNYKTGEVIENKPLEDQYFGEGLTILDGKLFQLTWRENTGFVYNLETLEKENNFAYNQSKEGWGLCNNGSKLYKSDGTEKIWTLNSQTQAEETYIEMYTNKSKIKAVNELEWIEGSIYANIYKQESIAIVNPKNGAVQGVINLKGLKEKVTQHNKLDVLNGIAYKGEPNILYVTGKNWDKLFKIEIFEKEE